MRAADFSGKRVAIWGLAREGRAAIGFIRAHCPSLPLLVLDDDPQGQVPADLGDCIAGAFGRERVAAALDRIDAIVKSPGVSLYREEIAAARARGVAVTSLLNLWFAEDYPLTTICVTGSKGKSTTASLIAHILTRLGRRAALAGNIGAPITEIPVAAVDYAVIELSSYQVADFAGTCDIAVLTSLFPEHIDWHRSVENYYRDKLNLLAHARIAIVDRDAMARVRAILGDRAPAITSFKDETAMHACDGAIFDGAARIGAVRNAYLARPHNLANLCAALTVVKKLGLSPEEGVLAASDFVGLPHRQQELGAIDGVLYVNDSISTAPEAAVAALDVYAGRSVTAILGGHDRGVDYGALIRRIVAGAAQAVICLGEAGERIGDELRAALTAASSSACTVYYARSMAEAVAAAKRLTPEGGVVLLSPAAPSYGAYRDFTERGRDFARCAGFSEAQAPR
jgi:UDP-N-acetylmuramoylalanine--D-glutamate ligase